MTELIFNWILPLWLCGIPITAFISLGVGFVGEQFDFVDNYYTKLSAKGKIQVTKLCLRDVPLWPLTMPVYAFFFLKKLRVKYNGWKGEANEEALRNVSRQLDQLENSFAAAKRLNTGATEVRQKYNNLLTKYGK